MHYRCLSNSSSTQAVESIEFLATRGLVFRKGSVQKDTHGCGCSEEGGEEWNGTVVISGSHGPTTTLAAHASNQVVYALGRPLPFLAKWIFSKIERQAQPLHHRIERIGPDA